MYAFPSLSNTKTQTIGANIIFRNVKQLTQIAIRETILLSSCKLVFRQLLTRVFRCISQNSLLFFNQFLHFLNKVNFNLGKLVKLINRCTLAKCFIHNKLALRSCGVKHTQQIIERFFVKILYKP